MRCTACGIELSDPQQFCPRCGKRLEGASLIEEQSVRDTQWQPPTFPLRKEAQRRLVNPVKSSARTIFLIVAGVLGLCMVTDVWVSVTHSHDPAGGWHELLLSFAPTRTSPLRYIARDTYGVVKIEDFAFLGDAAQREDLEALGAMLGDGRAYRVARGTRVTVVNDAVLPGLPCVIVETGSLIGKTLYLPTEELSTFNPSNTSGAYGNPGSGNPWEGAAAAAKAAAEKEAHGAAHRTY